MGSREPKVESVSTSFRHYVVFQFADKNDRLEQPVKSWLVRDLPEFPPNAGRFSFVMRAFTSVKLEGRPPNVGLCGIVDSSDLYLIRRTLPSPYKPLEIVATHPAVADKVWVTTDNKNEIKRQTLAA